MVSELKQLKYNKARLAILRLIAERKIAAGGVLPSTRELNELLPFGDVTILHALDSLKRDGIIVRKHGSGTYLKRELKDTAFRNNILYVLVMKRGKSIPGFGLEPLRHFLADRGLGLNAVSVYEFGMDVVEAARDSLGILADGWITDEFIEGISALKLPVMTLGIVHLDKKIPNVSPDVEQGAYRLTSLFTEDGMKRIAFFRGPSDYVLGSVAGRGYSLAMTEAGLEPLIKTSPLMESSLRADEFLDAHPDLEGILTDPGDFQDIASWIWRRSPKRLPSIAFLSTPGFYRNYRIDPRYRFVFYGNTYLRGAEILYEHITDGAPMISELIPPFIPGVDDHSRFYLG